MVDTVFNKHARGTTHFFGATHNLAELEFTERQMGQRVITEPTKRRDS
jgi:hypothetical protein